MDIPNKIISLSITFLLYCFGSLLSPSVAHADFTGKVLSVTDGDTLTVKYKKLKIKVRLQNIDAPEHGQPYGDAAHHLLKALVWHKQVNIRGEEKMDQYNRVLGVVELEGNNINAMMVEMGWAWVYETYNSDHTFNALQTKARNQRRGLWQDSSPVAPWIWRKDHKKPTRY